MFIIYEYEIYIYEKQGGVLGVPSLVVVWASPCQECLFEYAVTSSSWNRLTCGVATKHPHLTQRHYSIRDVVIVIGGR